MLATSSRRKTSQLSPRSHLRMRKRLRSRRRRKRRKKSDDEVVKPNHVVMHSYTHGIVVVAVGFYINF